MYRSQSTIDLVTLIITAWLILISCILIYYFSIINNWVYPNSYNNNKVDNWYMKLISINVLANILIGISIGFFAILYYFKKEEVKI